MVPVMVVPESEEEMAKACLHAPCVIALGPSDARTKLMACYAVLKYTKPRPAQRHAITASTPEDWLRTAIVAGAAISTRQMTKGEGSDAR